MIHRLCSLGVQLPGLENVVGGVNVFTIFGWPSMSYLHFFSLSFFSSLEFWMLCNPFFQLDWQSSSETVFLEGVLETWKTSYLCAVQQWVNIEVEIFWYTENLIGSYLWIN